MVVTPSALSARISLPVVPLSNVKALVSRSYSTLAPKRSGPTPAVAPSKINGLPWTVVALVISTFVDAFNPGKPMPLTLSDPPDETLIPDKSLIDPPGPSAVWSTLITILCVAAS